EGRMTAPNLPTSPPPQRSIIQREPVRVSNAVFTFLAAVNAILLGAGAYDGGIAAAVTGIIAAAGAFVGELVRADVVPYKPLQDLAASSNSAPPA
ncbi:MAG TPA: hypothetical protein VIX41_11465, partial [Acidimicrobiales bacterium]